MWVEKKIVPHFDVPKGNEQRHDPSGTHFKSQPTSPGEEPYMASNYSRSSRVPNAMHKHARIFTTN